MIVLLLVGPSGRRGDHEGGRSETRQAYRQAVPRGRRLPDWPAGRELVSEAESNGAPTVLVERLRNLPRDAEFSGPSEVAEALERQDESYEEQAKSRRGSF